MNEFLTKNQILQVLSDRREELTIFGIEEIGLFHPHERDMIVQNEEITIIVIFKRGKGSFQNFMQLVSFLERLLQRPVNLWMHYPGRTCIKPVVLAKTEYVHH